MFLMIYGSIFRIWVLPARDREAVQNKRIAELEKDNASLKEGKVKERLMSLEKEQLLQGQRLESGDRKFSDMCSDIRCMRDDIGLLKTEVAKTNTLLQNAIFRGVGEADGR